MQMLKKKKMTGGIETVEEWTQEKNFTMEVTKLKENGLKLAPQQDQDSSLF